MRIALLSLRKFMPWLALSVLTVLILWLGTYQQEVFTALRSRWGDLSGFSQAYPLLAPLSFVLAYKLVVALFLPITIVLMLAGGALFGVAHGLILSLAANTLGACISFLVSRRFLYARVKRQYAREFLTIARRMEKDGWFYLLLLRLTPLFPATVVNLIMGALPMRLGIFAAVTLFGSLPVMGFYVWIGTELMEINSLKDVLSPQLMAAFGGLAALLLVGKWGVSIMKQRQGIANGQESH